MKKRMIFLVALSAFILFGIFTLVINKNQRFISVNSDEVSSIVITE
jgi:hypothetical protein